LEARRNGHRAKTQGAKVPLGLDGDGCEQDVADDRGAVNRHERDQETSRDAEGIDNSRFVRLSKGLIVRAANGRLVATLFPSHHDLATVAHGCIAGAPRRTAAGSAPSPNRVTVS
jgi:hypothetical protein